MMGDAANDLEDWEIRQQIGGTWDQPTKPIFVIDTGIPQQRGIRDRLPDWFLDQEPEDATDARLAFDYGQWLIAAAAKPKTIKTVRLHLLAAWWFLPTLAEHHPEVFDELLCAYALRVEGVEA